MGTEQVLKNVLHSTSLKVRRQRANISQADLYLCFVI